MVPQNAYIYIRDPHELTALSPSTTRGFSLCLRRDFLFFFFPFVSFLSLPSGGSRVFFFLVVFVPSTLSSTSQSVDLL